MPRYGDSFLAKKPPAHRKYRVVRPRSDSHRFTSEPGGRYRKLLDADITGTKSEFDSPLLGVVASPPTGCGAITRPGPNPACGNTNASGNTSATSGGGSLRSTKLARRARSFKEDFLGRINQMRSPNNTINRSHSPQSGNMTGGKVNNCVSAANNSANDESSRHQPYDGSRAGASRDLERLLKQLGLALRHFRDVVSKKTLVMLPGNGTVLLDTVAAIQSALLGNELDPPGSALGSACGGVRQTLSSLIELCDEVLLHGAPALEGHDVNGLIQTLDTAVQNLVQLAHEKMLMQQQQNAANRNSGKISNGNAIGASPISNRASLEAGQRTSLPDIPLTPRERQILQQTSSSCSPNSSHSMVRTSHSTESLLRDDPPPPKPPLPGRNAECLSQTPPPLPPKRKQRSMQNTSLDDQEHVYMSFGMDRVSLNSRSPDDCASLLSAGSLDSALNQSREEEEIAALMCHDQDQDQDQDPEQERDAEQRQRRRGDLMLLSVEHQEERDETETEGRVNNSWDEPNLQLNITAPCNNGPSDSHRHSNESGFASMQSLRSSCQSFSKRSSQQSYSSFNSNMQQLSTNMKTISDNIVQQASNMSNITNYKEMYENNSQNTMADFKEQQISSNSSINYNEMSQRSVESVMQNLSCNLLDDSSSSLLKHIEDSGTTMQSFNQSEKKMTVVSSSTTLSNLSQMSNVSSINSDICDNGIVLTDDLQPPTLPQKTRSIKNRCRRERYHSTYDNLQDEEYEQTDSVTMSMNNVSSSSTEYQINRKCQERLELHNSTNINNMQPPPLPPKKKHIMAYMEMFGNCSRPLTAVGQHPGGPDFARHSVHTYALGQGAAEWQTAEERTIFTNSHTHAHYLSHSQTMSLSPYRHSQPPPSTLNNNSPVSPHIGSFNVNNTINNSSNESCQPPALPPKRRSKTSGSSPPASPEPQLLQLRSADSGATAAAAASGCYGNHAHNHNHVPTVDERYMEQSEMPESDRDSVFQNSSSMLNESNADKLGIANQDLVRPGEVLVAADETSPLDELDVSNYILLKKDDEEGPDIRGGHPDALVVLATKAKNDHLYQEAFLTTYRTFLTPLCLVQKLCYRHQRFSCQPDNAKQRAAKEAFSMLVRIVSELTINDLDSTLEPLREFCYQLISSGHLMMAKVLRSKLIEKFELKQSSQANNNANATLSGLNVFTSQAVLLDFKSEQIAEQMTLLDAELYLKIEIPEVLLWAQEQCEERSPNLTRFTEHFNKMSYWARSRILDQPDARDRERYAVKFLKIMKHLRKMNNFNSYLALLSALDSAPITRLEWPKQTTESLKEFCALIDSRSSFRAYRQALAESQSPCIPYIGLVLQDLTFIHIGNSDLLPDGSINFTKRWQQYHIVNNMKRFKMGSYAFKKNDRIIAYFNNFDNYLNEEAMWQISEGIKPRGVRKCAQ